MLSITLQDRRTNTWIRQQTGVTDINAAIKTSKHRWARHAAGLHDNRQTTRTRTAEWTSREQKKAKRKTKNKVEGRPHTPRGSHLAAESSKQIQMVQRGVPHLSDTNPYLID